MFRSFVVFTAAAAVANASSPRQGRVEGGVPVEPKYFHDQALVTMGAYGSCGGIIFDNTTIITAAHCIQNEDDPGKVPTELLTVYVGSKFRNQGQAYGVLYTIVHENYDARVLSNDIAILKLSTPLTYTEQVQPKQFVPAGFVFPPGTECIATGFGLTNRTHLSQELRAIPIILQTDYYCAAEYYYYDKQVHICGIGYEVSGTCKGDSGGPLVCKHEGWWFLYGIVSFGRRICGDPYSPFVPEAFTRIAPFYSWIKHASQTPQLGLY